ncbi:uncharacterized protein DMAD_05756 [Drosophila madeirensis]|uniref:Uncharacterized protein n=1 Tax=Drosophila madeirensis TaxID=30013 RepID=A0AAU9FNF6_DROMD
MKSCALFLFVLLAVFGSLSALISSRPSRECETVVKLLAPKCDSIQSLLCKRSFETVNQGKCYEDFLAVFEQSLHLEKVNRNFGSKI